VTKRLLRDECLEHQVGYLIQHMEIRCAALPDPVHLCLLESQTRATCLLTNQIGQQRYSMPVTAYGNRIDTEFPRELEHIWESMQNMAKIVTSPLEIEG
jgi:hypothetical protein